MTTETLRIGVCGVGTVGLATLHLLRDRSDEFGDQFGVPIKVIHVGARRDYPEHDYGEARVSRNVFEVAQNPDVDVLVELVGGTDIAYELVKLAIAKGKHVVTANKALIAQFGNELIALAESVNVQLRFEAAVGGGIPIIKTLKEGLAANRVIEIAGILNGTGNFIMTEMSRAGRSFEGVLKEAKTLGYAEADPTFDIDGTDVSQKLAILASISFGTPLNAAAIYREGIEKINEIDLMYAAELGYRIKHLGIARRFQDQSLEIRVHPTLIPDSQFLARVDGVLNGVLIKGDAVEDLLMVGPGAGGRATASAVCADLLDIALKRGSDARFALGLPIAKLIETGFKSPENFKSEWYIRLSAVDRPGVISEITGILASHDISVESLMQKPPSPGQSEVPIVMVTDVNETSSFRPAIVEISKLKDVDAAISALRIESFGS